jgi:hypothetical protein
MRCIVRHLVFLHDRLCTPAIPGNAKELRHDVRDPNQEGAVQRLDPAGCQTSETEDPCPHRHAQRLCSAVLSFAPSPMHIAARLLPLKPSSVQALPTHPQENPAGEQGIRTHAEKVSHPTRSLQGVCRLRAKGIGLSRNQL